MKPKVLFTGGTGLMAINWALSIRNTFDVVLGLHKRQIAVPGMECMPLSLDNTDELAHQIETTGAAYVIHCAGLANVEQCQADPALAKYIHVDLSANVAEACRHQKVTMVYVSTDQLFTGSRPMMTENDEPAPVNIYGQTKLDGERRSLDIHEDVLVARTNFYGWGPLYRRSFSDWIIDSLNHKKTIQLFEDSFYTPILVEDAAFTMMELLNRKARGVFNITGNQRVSKLQFGISVADTFGLDKHLIQPIPVVQKKDRTRRPADMSLSNEKASHYIGRSFGDYEDNLERLLLQDGNGFANIIRNI